MGEIIYVGFSLEEDILKRYAIASNVRTVTLRCNDCNVNTAGVIDPPEMHLRRCPACRKVLRDENDPRAHTEKGVTPPPNKQRLGW